MQFVFHASHYGNARDGVLIKVRLAKNVKDFARHDVDNLKIDVYHCQVETSFEWNLAI